MRRFAAIFGHHMKSAHFPLRSLIAAGALAMAFIGGARAVGGALYMSAGDAREALARETESAQSFSAAAGRLGASTRWWPFDARAWDAYGALYLEAAHARSGAITPYEATAAANALHQAVVQAPGQPLFFMRVAAAEKIAGRPDQAISLLMKSIETGPRHPQALRFRFRLGAALWEDLPAPAQAAVADQGAAAIRQGKAEKKFAAHTLRDAPPALRQETLRRLTPQERVTLISALRSR